MSDINFNNLLNWAKTPKLQNIHPEVSITHLITGALIIFILLVYFFICYDQLSHTDDDSEDYDDTDDEYSTPS